MARINLLPWREERRRQLSQEFARQAILAALFALAVGGYAWYHVNGMIDYQRERNDYLEEQIAVLQEEIEQIEELESTRRQLVARMNVIQRLQQRRPQIVHLFFEIADTLPDGVYLTQVTQKGDKLSVNGRAESNARVSSYMRRLDASPWLTDPELQIIQSDDEDVSRFTLNLAQTVPDADNGDGELLMDVGEAIQKLNNLDVQDLRKIGTAPKPIQIAVILVLVAAILGAIGWFVVRPQFETLEKEERTEQELRETFEEKQSRAANLEAYKKQLAQMEESFGAMLRQLPDETDMESLLVDLSQTSVAAGLEVKYFEPGNERQQEFYAEYPIELRVAGTYHEFGNFVSGLASLPRIVTLHDIAIKPSGNGNATGQNVDLSMQLEAKTYRYLEEGGGGSGN